MSLVFLALSAFSIVAGHVWFVVIHTPCLYVLLLATRQQRRYSEGWMIERYGRLKGLSMLLVSPGLVFAGAVAANNILPTLYPLYSANTLNTLYIGVNITAFITVFAVDMLVAGVSINELRLLTASDRAEARKNRSRHELVP